MKGTNGLFVFERTVHSLPRVAEVVHKHQVAVDVDQAVDAPVQCLREAHKGRAGKAQAQTSGNNTALYHIHSMK
jgi:hypothetical protein